MPVVPETRLREATELLFRQASPGWIRDGRPTSQLFRPTPKDHGLLSVDRESVVGSAAVSRERFLARGFQSHSTWGVSVGEVNSESLEAYADPTRHNDAHALIDMSHLDERKQRSVGERLRDAAERHGQFAPSVPVAHTTHSPSSIEPVGEVTREASTQTPPTAISTPEPSQKRVPRDGIAKTRSGATSAPSRKRR
jgi:hypothetical protein